MDNLLHAVKKKKKKKKKRAVILKDNEVGHLSTHTPDCSGRRSINVSPKLSPVKDLLDIKP